MANKLITVSTLDEFKTKIEDEIPDSVQYSTMPTASADLAGKIVQYTGSTTASYTNGYFYKCATGETVGTYEWIPVAVQDGSGEQLVWLGTRAEHTAAETAGTLPETAIIGITDESGGGGGGGGDIIDDENVSTETTYSSSKIEELFDFVNVTWKYGTDEQIVQALALADAGELSPANFWAVGDTRKISLSAISPSTGVDETQDAQDVEMVIVQLGLYKDANDKTVNAIVHLKDCLATTGKMNTTATNAGSWDSCPRRTWLNGNFRNAIPSSIRSIFKQFKTVTAKEQNSSELTTSLDYFALPAAKEICGNVSTSSTAEEAIALTQWDYYKVTANIIKKIGTSAVIWWFRSPCANNVTDFCIVNSSGSPRTAGANKAYGITPFGCI